MVQLNLFGWGSLILLVSKLKWFLVWLSLGITAIIISKFRLAFVTDLVEWSANISVIVFQDQDPVQQVVEAYRFNNNWIEWTGASSCQLHCALVLVCMWQALSLRALSRSAELALIVALCACVCVRVHVCLLGSGQCAQAARGRGPEWARGPWEAAQPRELDLWHGEVRERAGRWRGSEYERGVERGKYSTQPSTRHWESSDRPVSFWIEATESSAPVKVEGVTYLVSALGSLPCCCFKADYHSCWAALTQRSIFK